MSARSAYWLGLLTPVVLAAVGFVLLFVGLRVKSWLNARGWSMDLRWRRDLDGVSEYTLRHDIWWERSFGPFFVGGWYREVPTYDKPDQMRATRWLGIGHPSGPCACFYRLRHLGERA